jgi:hypothetical protein
VEAVLLLPLPLDGRGNGEKLDIGIIINIFFRRMARDKKEEKTR